MAEGGAYAAALLFVCDVLSGERKHPVGVTFSGGAHGGYERVVCYLRIGVHHAVLED